ncbi:MAG TPA: lactonase family protein [Bryobacteraceae bacterium]|nr:lactonase family protein [Bryobacteraceae bacterium]
MPARNSRRQFIMSAAAIAAVTPVDAESAPILAYVGTYSSREGAEGAAGRGKGIYLLEMNPATGVLVERAVFENGSNPSCLAINRAGTRLYSANETQSYEGANSGSVSAYEIEHPSGRLKLINTVSSEGAGPCYLSLHQSGKWAFIANYHGGTSAVLPIGANGALGAASDVKHHEGTLGPTQPTSAPRGSFAWSGHDRTHSHMILPDPSGRFVLAADLGLDRILIWKFDAEAGKLIPNDPPSVSVAPGDGPRHFAFHPNGRVLYSLQEEGSTLVTFDYDGATGKLTAKQTISSLPANFAGTNFTSEVAVSPDGRFVYAANRLHDTIAWFSIAGDGKLQFVGEQSTGGDYPRSFTFDPSWRFVYSCNQRADAIVSFKVNRKTGALTPTGQYTPIGTPSHLVFLP